MEVPLICEGSMGELLALVPRKEPRMPLSAPSTDTIFPCLSTLAVTSGTEPKSISSVLPSLVMDIFS